MKKMVFMVTQLLCKNGQAIIETGQSYENWLLGDIPDFTMGIEKRAGGWDDVCL